MLERSEVVQIFLDVANFASRAREHEITSAALRLLSNTSNRPEGPHLEWNPQEVRNPVWVSVSEFPPPLPPAVNSRERLSTDDATPPRPPLPRLLECLH